MKYLACIVVIYAFISGSSGCSDCEYLDSHNEFRALHRDTPALVWDSNLAQQATEYAEGCNWGHSGTSGVAENLHVQSRSDNLERGAVTGWYNEISKYDYSNPGFNKNTGHFTQVVWKSTTRVGCGSAVCSGPRMMGWQQKYAYYVVCQYQSAGNVKTRFRDNVRPLK